MINSFHMNPWLYLSFYPIYAIIHFIMLRLINFNQRIRSIFIYISIFILLLLVYLYINNIIGLFDLIILALIFGINSSFYLVSDLFLTSYQSVFVILLALLPILALTTSFIYKLN